MLLELAEKRAAWHGQQSRGHALVARCFVQGVDQALMFVSEKFTVPSLPVFIAEPF